MNPFAFLSLISALIAFFIGTFVFAKGTHRRRNIIFMFFCISFTLLGIAEYGMRLANTYQTALFWSKFSNLLILPISLLFHFSLELSNISKKVIKFIYPIIYIMLGLFTVLSLTTNLIDKNPVYRYWGWTYGVFQNPIYSFYYNLWSTWLVLMAFLIFFLNYIKATKKLQKIRSEYILIGFLISLFIFLIFDYFNVNFFGIELPEFGITGFTICCAFIGYAIRKYDLFKVNFSAATNDVIKNLLDTLILTDLSGTILAVNDATCNMLKYSQQELIGRNIKSVVVNNNTIEIKRLNNLSDHLPKEITVEDREMRYLTGENEEIPISLSISMIKNVLREPTGLLFIGRDISARKTTEGKLKDLLEEKKKYIDEILKSSKVQSRLIATMSHELRTPLNSIIGFSDLLLEESMGELNEQQKEYLNDIYTSSEQLLNLINDLLDLSRTRSEELELQIRKVNLKKFINEILSNFKPLAKTKNLWLKVEGLEDNESLHADPIRLMEIFQNLLSNAIKYTIDGGVTLKITKHSEYWKFDVIDTGIGIAEEDYNILFQEFKRVENPLVRSIEGTGLGLPLVKRLVSLHEGELSFTSKLGKGSKFTFTIPHQ